MTRRLMRIQGMLDGASTSDQQLSAAVESAGYRVVSIDPEQEERGVAPAVRDGSLDYDLVVLGSGSAAAGDVTRHPQFVSVAAHDGSMAARNAITDEQAVQLSCCAA